jgi:hypothetical protein
MGLLANIILPQLSFSGGNKGDREVHVGGLYGIRGSSRPEEKRLFRIGIIKATRDGQ